jgi:hypothetical protein
MRFRQLTLNAKPARPPCLLLIISPLLGSCGERSRTVIEIVTRGGATFILVEPQANYERVCMDGQYSLNGDPDKQGLRAIAADACTAVQFQKLHFPAPIYWGLSSEG